jgi:hypothetical protein
MEASVSACASSTTSRTLPNSDAPRMEGIFGQAVNERRALGWEGKGGRVSVHHDGRYKVLVSMCGVV